MDKPREHGILMKDAMVRALLRPVGDPLRKTVTRRTSGRWAKVRPDDLMWVREAWTHRPLHEYEEDRTWIDYAADGARRMPEITGEQESGGDWLLRNERHQGKGRPGIHMPRWASRLTLRVVDVREEKGRLLCSWCREVNAPPHECVDRQVSAAAKAGLDLHPSWSSTPLILPCLDDAEARREGVADRAAYLALWREINGDDFPPTLWRIEFEEASRG